MGSWWHCQGESTMTTLHAHTPSRLLTTAIREGSESGLDHPRIGLAAATVTATATATGFAAVAGTGYRISWSLLPPFRTSGIRRIEKCSVSFYVIAFLYIIYIPQRFLHIWKCSKKLVVFAKSVVQIKTETSFRFELTGRRLIGRR